MFNISLVTPTAIRLPQSKGPKTTDSELSYDKSSVLDKYQRKVMLK